MNKECTPFVVKIKGGRYWHSSTCFYFPRLSFYSDAILAWSAVHPNTAIIAINSSFFIMIVLLFFFAN